MRASEVATYLQIWPVAVAAVWRFFVDFDLDESSLDGLVLLFDAWSSAVLLRTGREGSAVLPEGGGNAAVWEMSAIAGGVTPCARLAAVLCIEKKSISVDGKVMRSIDGQVLNQMSRERGHGRERRWRFTVGVDDDVSPSPK